MLLICEFHRASIQLECECVPKEITHHCVSGGFGQCSGDQLARSFRRQLSIDCDVKIDWDACAGHVTLQRGTRHCVSGILPRPEPA